MIAAIPRLSTRKEQLTSFIEFLGVIKIAFDLDLV